MLTRLSGRTVHAVQIDEDVVVLDLAREAYLCLPAWRLDAERRGRLGLDDSGSLEGALPPPGLSPSLPTSDLGDPPDGPRRLRDISSAARAAAELLLAYRGRTLSELIAYVEARRRPQASSDHVLELARDFHSWAPLAPAPGKCLVRSFMLLRHLQRHGAAAQWVFGVRTWPFRAHCWVQSGEVALDDAHERLSPYAPILAVQV